LIIRGHGPLWLNNRSPGISVVLTRQACRILRQSEVNGYIEFRVWIGCARIFRFGCAASGSSIDGDRGFEGVVVISRSVAKFRVLISHYFGLGQRGTERDVAPGTVFSRAISVIRHVDVVVHSLSIHYCLKIPVIDVISPDREVLNVGYGDICSLSSVAQT